MEQKPLKKHGGRTSAEPVNAVMKALLQESHFTIKEFAKFAKVSQKSIESYLYFRASPVCKNGTKHFWNRTATKLAAAFGLTPEELFPVETWENEVKEVLNEHNFGWRVDNWRKTNTGHLINKHDMSHQLYEMLLTLPKDKRMALMKWAMRKPMDSYAEFKRAQNAIIVLRKFVAKKRNK